MKEEKKKRLKSILHEKMLELQKLSYEELCKFIDNPQHEEYGEGDDYYQIEFEAVYDNPKNKDVLRVIASIDDGGGRAFFMPFCEDFLISKDGKLL